MDGEILDTGKKERCREAKNKVDESRKVKSRHSFITVDVGEKKENRNKKTRTTTTTVKDQSYKPLTNTKRKPFEECNSRKVKKRKTSLGHEERQEYQKQTDQNAKPKRESQHANSKDKYANAQNNEDSFQEYDIIHNLWRPSEELMQRFGLRKGRWTKKEEIILRENMDRYLREHNIDDPKKLVFPYRDTATEEGKKWKEFVKSTDFYKKLSKGLKRNLYSVYVKTLYLYEDNDHVGKFSESEDKELFRLVAVHGTKWTKIGVLMGRGSRSVQRRYLGIKDERNTGPWQESEVKCLQEAVRKLTNTKDGEEVYCDICWVAVASIVKTRNYVQCRQKWVNGTCWKDCSLYSTEKRWGPENDVELIDKIYKSQVTEECDIDWLSLTTDFEMARSPAWLTMKFWNIKRKYCKCIDFEVTEFEDVIDYLYNVIAIDLQNQIFQQQNI